VSSHANSLPFITPLLRLPAFGGQYDVGGAGKVHPHYICQISPCVKYHLRIPNSPR
jgi:hypothetical protein